MSEEAALSIQNQIRVNSDELQSFLKDLDTWEKDMKKKEGELKLIQASEADDFPPIRNSNSRSKKKNRQKKQSIGKAEEKVTEVIPANRISSYDYKAWENFDVDSELKRLDSEKKDSSASDESDDENTKALLNKQLAILKKDKGNEFFKNGNYDSAINYYTMGIELDPENAVLPANRAMAFLKKEQYQAAENDCDTCLYLDPTYVKAYLRRGTARKALKKITLANSDFHKALQLEPDNVQAANELEKLKTESDGDLEEYNEEDIGIKEISSKPLSKPESSANFEKLKNSLKDTSSKSTVTSTSPKDSSKNIIEILPSRLDSSKGDSLKAPSDKSSVKLQNKGDTKNPCEEIGDVISTLEQTLPPVPSASYQFLIDWKIVSKYPELRYQYLKQFPPEKFPILFKNYMEPEIFPELLHTLSTNFIENGDEVFYYLKYLGSVGRFNTMLLFLGEAEKNDLQKLAAYINTSGYPDTEVEELMKLYGM